MLHKVYIKCELLLLKQSITDGKDIKCNIDEQDEIRCVNELFYLTQNKNCERFIQIFGEEASARIIIISPTNEEQYTQLRDITKSIGKPDVILDIIKLLQLC